MSGEIGDYCGIDFIGGGIGAVDKIDGAVLQDKDHFLVVTPTVFAPLSLDADSGAGENSPQSIAPNINPGNKRWILVGGVFASLVSYGNVGIHESSPERYLHITGVDTGAGTFDSYANAIIEDTGTSWLYFMSDIAGNAGIAWGDTADPFVSCINYNHDGDYLRFYVNNAERMRINSNGVAIGLEVSDAYGLHVSHASWPPTVLERITGDASGFKGTVALRITTSVNMVNGFGGGIVFQLQDDAEVVNDAAAIYVSREGGDTLGDLLFRTGGIAYDRMILPASGALLLLEQAAASVDIAAYGQIWVKTATPNELWFTDDAGTDHQIAYV